MQPETEIIFDTNCILCSGFVQFILKHEKHKNIIFINAWSETGLAIAKEHGLDEAALHRTYLVICYKWFGYSEQCFLPPETEKHRFIDR